jgi:putative pyruvate formate lyase activating enzyme
MQPHVCELSETSTLPPPTAAELWERARHVRAELASCELCEHRCRIDRLNRGAPDSSKCGLHDQTYCFKRHVSFAEELSLLPSYMVYFGGCNFRCSFCIQAPRCFDGRRGALVDAQQLARDSIAIVGKGARTINLLGGEPTLHLHTILELAAHAAESGERLPLAINSNMYMTPGVIDALDGVATMYIADYKFGNDRCAMELANISRYTSIVQRNLLHAQRTARVLVRHLVMPGHIECCMLPFAAWMQANMPNAEVTLMTGYAPSYRVAAGACNGGDMNRLLTREEAEHAHTIFKEFNLREAT